MRRLLLVGLGLALGGCFAEAPPNSGCTPATPCGDEIVAGVNLTRLTAAPTAAEVAAVRSRWAPRTAAAASAPDLFPVATVTSATDGAEVAVYAAAEGVDTLFYVAARRPLRAPGDVARRPVVLVLAEGPLAADNLPAQTGLNATYYDEVVVVGVAPRGEVLTVGGRAFRSRASGTPYLTDADDAQRTAARIQQAEFLANASRLAVVGSGRGGAAALQMRARGAISSSVDVDAAVAFGAPTSWLAPSVRDALRTRLSGSGSSPLPAFDAVFADAVAPLRDGAIALPEARLRLLERSSAPFLVPPATAPAEVRVVAAFGSLDTRLPIDQRSLELGASGAVLVVDGATRDALPADLGVISVVTNTLEDRLSL